MNAVTITKRGADRIRRGHLWVYRSDVVTAASAGPVVSIYDQHGNFLGQALYSDVSEIALRVLSKTSGLIDREWWRQRIREAAARRAHLAEHTNAYRMVYSEADMLPSLIVDRYDDVLALQTLSQGTESLKQMLVELLVEEFAPGAVVERNDVRVRELEGLDRVAGSLHGEAPDCVEIVSDDIRFVIEPLGGQKTGAFLDQRENRLAARKVGQGRALDCFAFTGGFALYLAGVCKSVLGIDISTPAVEAARHNADLNRAANAEFREGNVFDALREMEDAGEHFDTVVLDPPAFAKNRASVQSALRGYKEINLRALKLLNPGGVLVTCTCSYHVTEEMFVEIIAAAGADAHRTLQLVEKRMQASDHPVLVGVPETYYLKCLVLRTVD